MVKSEPSRIDNNPATASTSLLVRITPAIGLWRSWPCLGCSCGVALSCWRRSGEALTRNQCSPSALTAIEAWVLLSSGCPFRAVRHTGHPQFHCGTPPPAAAPRTTTRSMIRLLEIRTLGLSQRHDTEHYEIETPRGGRRPMT